MQTEAVDLPVSHKMWAWFETNKKQAGWAALAIIVVSCIVVYVVYQRDQKQVDAGEALSSVTIPQVTGLRQGDVTPAYMKVASEYPKSPAGLQALLLAAADLFEKGKYAEAQQQFERIVREQCVQIVAELLHIFLFRTGPPPPTATPAARPATWDIPTPLSYKLGSHPLASSR